MLPRACQTDAANPIIGGLAASVSGGSYGIRDATDKEKENTRTAADLVFYYAVAVDLHALPDYSAPLERDSEFSVLVALQTTGVC